MITALDRTRRADCPRPRGCPRDTGVPRTGFPSASRVQPPPLHPELACISGVNGIGGFSHSGIVNAREPQSFFGIARCDSKATRSRDLRNPIISLAKVRRYAGRCFDARSFFSAGGAGLLGDCKLDWGRGGGGLLVPHNEAGPAKGDECDEQRTEVEFYGRVHFKTTWLAKVIINHAGSAPDRKRPVWICLKSHGLARLVHKLGREPKIGGYEAQNGHLRSCGTS